MKDFKIVYKANSKILALASLNFFEGKGKDKYSHFENRQKNRGLMGKYNSHLSTSSTATTITNYFFQILKQNGLQFIKIVQKYNQIKVLN